MAVHLLYDPAFLTHNTGVRHYENEQRLECVLKALAADEQLSGKLNRLTPRPATEQDLLRCHDQGMIHAVQTHIELGGTRLDSDTAVSPESYNVACLAAGAAITAVDAVMAGE